ncbi:transposase [Nonomuraea monospora]|uniref:transposase n=1 Tax=Nonomuraea monospora TaxID=568818 RepID=UPI003CD0B9B7
MLPEARAWQSRLLDPCYPAVFFGAIVVKVRDNNPWPPTPPTSAATSTCRASGWPKPRSTPPWVSPSACGQAS